MPGTVRPESRGRDWVATILAIGFATSLNTVTLAMLYDAIQGDTGLSENATQVLTTGFAGFAGLLGGYLGARAAHHEPPAEEPELG